MRKLGSLIANTLSTEPVGVLIFVVVVGFAVYGLLQDLAFYVVLPVIGAALDTNLLEKSLSLGGGGEFEANEIYFGRLLAP